MESKEYAACKKAGICCDCGKQYATGKSRCPDCLEKINNRRRQRENQGICPCGEIVAAGHRRCQKCLDENSEKTKAESHRRVRKGLCGQCGKHPIAKDRSRSRCSSCLDKEKEKSSKNKLAISKKGRAKRLKMRFRVIEAYGGFKCACCGETNPLFLSIDHIDGGGTKHREKLGDSGDAIVRYLTKAGFPPGYQVLCHNCNQGKYSNGGVCPHKQGAVKMVSGYTDDPEFDGTDAAHPAYWRGQDDGVRGAVERIRQALDGQDDGVGVLGGKDLEKLRRDIIELRRRMK